jgi:hypothetical protein
MNPRKMLKDKQEVIDLLSMFNKALEFTSAT